MKGGQMMDVGITTANMLKEFITVIFNKAVEETTFCPMYSQLLSDLNEKLPPFPSEQPGGKEITVKRIISNIFQEGLKVADKQRIPLGNIPFIGELLKQKLVPEWIVHHIVHNLLGPSWLPEVYIKPLCQLLNTIGKQLDESPKSSQFINDMYFRRLKELSSDPQLPPQLRFMVCDVLNLRANNWIPLPDPAAKMNTDDLHCRIVSFLEKYFSDRYSVDALKCVDDLKTPAFHPEIVKEAIFLALTKSPRCLEAVFYLIDGLFLNCTFSARDIETGCLLFAPLVDDIGIAKPDSPNYFGVFIGKLVLAGCLDFMAVRDILKKVNEVEFQQAIFDRSLKAISLPDLCDFLDDQCY